MRRTATRRSCLLHIPGSINYRKDAVKKYPERYSGFSRCNANDFHLLWKLNVEQCCYWRQILLIVANNGASASAPSSLTETSIPRHRLNGTDVQTQNSQKYTHNKTQKKQLKLRQRNWSRLKHTKPKRKPQCKPTGPVSAVRTVVLGVMNNQTNMIFWILSNMKRSQWRAIHARTSHPRPHFKRSF